MYFFTPVTDVLVYLNIGEFGFVMGYINNKDSRLLEYDDVSVGESYPNFRRKV